MPRLSINMSSATSASLSRLAERHETSVTEIVRRAVAVYEMVDEAHHGGSRITVDDESTGDRIEVRLLCL